MKNNLQTNKEGFGSTANNFRTSSKDNKGQQSTKNLASNVNSYATLNRKGKEDINAGAEK